MFIKKRQFVLVENGMYINIGSGRKMPKYTGKGIGKEIYLLIPTEITKDIVYFEKQKMEK